MNVFDSKLSDFKISLNIQYLRALAVICVVLFHIVGTSKNYNFNYYNYLSIGNWGEYGVDLFFVISGYIISYSQFHSKKTFKKFLINRILRILPIYYLLTLFLILLIFMFPTLFKSWNLETEDFIYSFLFLSTYHYKMPLIYVGWSLEFEVLFYLIFSLSILFKNILKEHIFISVVIFGIYLFFKPGTIIFEFILGILVFNIYNSYKIKSKFSFLIIILGLCMFFYNSRVNIDLEQEVKNNLRFFYFGIPAAIVLYGSLCAKEFKFNILKTIGNASYSIYLIQVFTIPFFFKALEFFNFSGLQSLFFLLNATFTVLGGIIFYIYFEKKLLISGKKIFFKK